MSLRHPLRPHFDPGLLEAGSSLARPSPPAARPACGQLGGVGGEH